MVEHNLVMRRLTITVPEQVITAARDLGARRRLPVSKVIAEAVLAEQRRVLIQDMREGYEAMAEENLALAEAAIAVDNETWSAE